MKYTSEFDSSSAVGADLVVCDQMRGTDMSEIDLEFRDWFDFPD